MSKKRGMDLVVKPPREIRKWTEVFGTTRAVGVYSMKRTRALCSQTICGCEEHVDWRRTVHLLKAAGVPEERSSSGSPVNATEYEYSYSFLGGKFTTVGGDYWGGKHGAYVDGIRTLRYICYGLNLTQPRKTAGETSIPTLADLRQELARETGLTRASSAATPMKSHPTVAASNPSEPEPRDEPAVCPYCRSTTGGCEHLFALIDKTFATVSGPASDIYHDLAPSNPDEGVTASDVQEFIAACDESCGYCLECENEGGPGMSSVEYWCWSDNVTRDLVKLREAMIEARRVDPK